MNVARKSSHPDASRYFPQLINRTETPCRVLYIVSPPYLFDKGGDQVIYDDYIRFDEDWKELEDWNWQPPGLYEANLNAEFRLVAAERVALRKRNPSLK